MKRVTFGEELLQFSKTVDILDKKIFSDIKKIINQYAKKTWGVEYVKIMQLGMNSNGDRILKKFFLEEYNYDDDSREIYTCQINPATGKVEGQMPYVTQVRKAVWITCKNRGVLNSNSENIYIDQWSGLRDMPSYYMQKQENIKDIKTSIIVPFFDSGSSKKHIKGVVNYEIPEYLSSTKECRVEIRQLTNTIAELLNLYHMRRRQERNTTSAIKTLKSKLEYLDYYKRKNKIFFAFPHKGEQDVHFAIKELLHEKFPSVVVNDWNEMTQTGSVTDQVFDEIEASKYGICYFSERVNKKSDVPHYRDNLNVIFEAGLMHSKYRTHKDSRPLWIPIREEGSPEIQFDLHHLRMIIVPRYKRGKNKGALKKEAFHNLLRKFLVKILEE